MHKPQQTDSTPISLLQQAAALFQRGQWRDSAAICRGLLANGHALFDVFHLYGLSLFQLKQYSPAEEYLNRAIERDPNNAQARNSLGAVYHAQQDWTAAEYQFTRAIELKPQYWEPWRNLNSVLLAQEHYEKAKSLLEQAEKLFHGQREFLKLKASTLRKSGDLRESLAVLEQIITNNQEDFDAINDKGVTLNLLGEFELSVSYFENIIKCEPNYVAAYINLGYSLYKLGRFKPAKSVFLQAIGLLENIDNLEMLTQLQRNGEDRELLIAKVNFLLSSIELVQGNYFTGWRYYSNRPSILLHRRLLPEKLPGDLAGKKVLLVNDQGIGDEIFFLRFAQEIKRRGAHLSYLATHKTAPLLEKHPYLDKVILEQDDEVYEYQLSIGDLALSLNILSQEDLPRPLPLSPAELPADLRSQLNALPRPWVGVSWRAGIVTPGNALGVETPLKEIPLETLSALFEDFKGSIIILQRLPQDGEIDKFKNSLSCPVVDFSHCNDTLNIMLGILQNLDEYIGVSNTNMHLRGSLGLSASVLIPFPPEWRWLETGDSSPWYPDFSLYRQGEDGSWDAAISRLRESLGKR